MCAFKVNVSEFDYFFTNCVDINFSLFFWFFEDYEISDVGFYFVFVEDGVHEELNIGLLIKKGFDFLFHEILCLEVGKLFDVVYE